MSNKQEIKQFKLNSGDEIVCEIIEWASEEYQDLLIRRAYAITCVLGPDYTRYYAMKPWMTVAEGPNNLIALNAMSIIGEANPSVPVLKHYHSAVKESEMSEKEVVEKINKLTQKLNKKNSPEITVNEEDLEEDFIDEHSNVVTLYPKKPTLH